VTSNARIIKGDAAKGFFYLKNPIPNPMQRFMPYCDANGNVTIGENIEDLGYLAHVLQREFPDSNITPPLEPCRIIQMSGGGEWFALIITNPHLVYLSFHQFDTISSQIANGCSTPEDYFQKLMEWTPDE
jgi:hypothetical protein